MNGPRVTLRGAGSAAAGPLEQYLTEWLQQMGDPSVPGQSRLGGTLQYLRESRTSLVVMVVLTVLAFVDTVLESSDRPLADRVSMRTLCGGISSIVALTILRTRKRAILATLQHARRAAVALRAGGEGKGEMAAEARWGRLVLWRLSAFYAAFVVAGVVLTMLNDSTAVNRGIYQFGYGVAWWQPWGPVVLHGTKWAVVELYGVSCCNTALFTVLFFEQAVHRVCAVLLREVGRRLQDPPAKAGNLANIIAVHTTVLHSCHLINGVFGLLLPLYLLISVSLSLLSTVALVQSGGDVDTFAVSCFPYLFIFFVPMCLAGQRVLSASEGLAFDAYSGPWLEEAPRTRRCRLVLMASCARPACFAVPGVGSLNHPTCAKGLRSWFQFVQVLMNLKTH